MDTVLIIGAGAAGSVVAQKGAMNRDVFKTIHLASRRIESCKAVAKRCNPPLRLFVMSWDASGVPRRPDAGGGMLRNPAPRHGTARPWA